MIVSEFAKEKLEEKNLKDKYIKLYYHRYGDSRGLQLVFDENIDETYEVYEIDGCKIALAKDLLEVYDYIEIKYSDHFIQQGFYPCLIRPGEHHLY